MVGRCGVNGVVCGNRQVGLLLNVNEVVVASLPSNRCVVGNTMAYV